MALSVLDTSVLIAMVDASDVHHASAREVVDAARAAGDEFIVPVVAYAEYLVGAFEVDPMIRAFRDGLIDAIPARVEPATRDVGRQAAEIRAQHGRRVRLPDALIIATAVVVGADRIITADRGWPAVGVSVTLLKAA